MQVKVWNDNDYKYKEKFRDLTIEIPPKGFIQMEEDQAILFKGSFAPIIRNHDGVGQAEGFKMIRIEYFSPEDKVKKLDTIPCAACSYGATNQKDLDEHIKSTHSHLENVVDAEAEAEIKVKKTRKAG